jgi:hypothetical protein
MNIMYVVHVIDGFGNVTYHNFSSRRAAYWSVDSWELRGFVCHVDEPLEVLA